MTEQTFTADQAAAITTVPAATIRRWSREGRIAPADVLPSRGRKGSIELFTLAELQPEVDRYLARHAARSSGA